MPKRGQIPLSFPERSLSFAEMKLTGANRAAIAAVRQVARWPYHVFCLVGPAQSGLSTIALAWAHENAGEVYTADAFADLSPSQLDAVADGSVALDRADLVGDQARLLQLISSAERRGGRVLMTAHAAPSHWTVASPDLASRLRSAPIAGLAPPDEALMRARLQRAFARHFLALSPVLEDYLVVRLGQSYAHIEDTVAQLSGAAAGRAVTVPLARELLSDDTGTVE